jgi:hypothetical protein
MAFAVRIFGHSGIVAMKVVNDSGQNHQDSVYQLSQPYVWTQTLSVGAVAVSSAAVIVPVSGFSNDPTAVLRIEVPDGQAIRYELNPPGRTTVAGTLSPKMSGADQYQFGSQWTVSIVDASGLP